MCALYKFAPEFIEEGRLYWLRSPLYVVESNKKRFYYYNDEEYNARSVNGITARIKGLGSLSSDQAHESMFTDEFQRMDQLLPDSESFFLLKRLMGDDAQPKHDFIFDNLDFSIIRE